MWISEKLKHLVGADYKATWQPEVHYLKNADEIHEIRILKFNSSTIFKSPRLLSKH